VSTVWIGIDHRFGDDGPPLIFETMVFNRAEGWGELDCERYSTEAEAVAGHAAMCEKWAHEQVQS
jgi:predicted cobalt transporter CbtA